MVLLKDKATSSAIEQLTW